MLVRDACPGCGSTRFKKNGHIHSGKRLPSSTREIFGANAQAVLPPKISPLLPGSQSGLSPRMAPRAFIFSEPCARPTSCRLAASRRDERDRPRILTPCAPLSTAGSIPTAPAGPIDTRTRPRYTRAARSCGFLFPLSVIREASRSPFCLHFPGFVFCFLLEGCICG
jgi:hypothetical protein